jgi:hypothetical protein
MIIPAPLVLGQRKDPFDDPGWIFEISTRCTE